MKSIFAARAHRLLTVVLHCSLALAVIGVVNPVSSQPLPAVQWSHQFGGDAIDQARAVHPTPDGGYLVVGFGDGEGEEAGEGAIVKLDSAGQLLWRLNCGNSGYDRFFSLDVLSNGDFVAIGITMTGPWNYEAWLIRFNADGVQIWATHFGGSMNDQGYAVTTTSDGGFAVAGLDATLGAGRYLAYLVKLTADGAMEWERGWGVESVNVEARSVHECPDGGFIITGGSVSYGEWNSPFDMFVVRTSASGERSWVRRYGGRGNDFASDAVCLDNGDFLITGFTASRGAGQRDICLMRINANGRRIWSRTYGGRADDAAFAVKAVSDGGFVLSGLTSSRGHGSTDLFLMKTGARGARQWIRTYGGAGVEFPWSNQCFDLTSDHGYILTGTTVSSQNGNENMWVVKTGPDRSLDSLFNSETENGDWIESEFEDFDETSSAVENPGTGTAQDFLLVSSYPNPFNPATTIEFTIPRDGFVTFRVYNIHGQIVSTLVEGQMTRGNHAVAFNGAALPSGVYYGEVVVNGTRAMNRMVLLK
jgi:uncharacterized delta-60 repeat protein